MTRLVLILNGVIVRKTPEEEFSKLQLRTYEAIDKVMRTMGDINFVAVEYEKSNVILIYKFVDKDKSRYSFWLDSTGRLIRSFIA